MSLNTSITRDGEPLTLEWSWWTVQCMVSAVLMEANEPLWTDMRTQQEALAELDKLKPSVEGFGKTDKLANILHGWNERIWERAWEFIRSDEVDMMSGFTLKEDHKFTLNLGEDKKPGEKVMGFTHGYVLDLKAGDVLWMNI